MHVASMDLFDEVGMERLSAKGRSLTGYLEFLLDQIPGRDFEIITPRDSHHRGAQLSLCFKKNGKETFKRLAGADVVCDWREPDTIRVAPVPFYNSYTDVHRFFQSFLNKKD